jgi:hypothetical protein
MNIQDYILQVCYQFFPYMAGAAFIFGVLYHLATDQRSVQAYSTQFLSNDPVCSSMAATSFMSASSWCSSAISSASRAGVVLRLAHHERAETTVGYRHGQWRRTHHTCVGICLMMACGASRTAVS